MASVRLLCLFNGRAAGWSKTLARTGCRNVCSSPSRLQSMSAWVIDQYGSSGVLRHTEEIPIPTVNFAHDVMINVSAASLNPLDLNMRGKCYSGIISNNTRPNYLNEYDLRFFSSVGGYGATLLNLRRDPLSLVNSFSEFPLILGRDLSGVVVDCGSGVTHFAPGDEVSTSIQICLRKNEEQFQCVAKICTLWYKNRIQSSLTYCTTHPFISQYFPMLPYRSSPSFSNC